MALVKSGVKDIMNRASLNRMLKEDREKNIALLGFIDNYPITKIYREKNSILLLGESDHLWAFIASNSLDEVRALMDSYAFERYYFSSTEDWIAPVIKSYGQVDWSFDTYRYIYPKGRRREQPKLPLMALDPSFASYIYSHSDYQEHTTIEYIEERLCNDVSSGLIIDNRLVAWGLTHDDGAIGFLHVLPAFREKGYGTEVVRDLILKKDRKSKDIFVNVTIFNDRGRCFFSKIGFEFDRAVSWIKLQEHR